MAFWTWALVASVVLVAAFLQSSTGFGFSQVSVPFLITLFTPRDTLQITLTLSLAISLVMLRSTHAEVDMSLLKRWILSAMVGLPVGVLLFHLLPVLWIKLALAASLAVAMVFLSFRLRLRRTARRDALAGFLSGALTSSIGLPGPPLLVYTLSINLEKSVIRSTTLTFHTVVYGFGVVALIVSQGVSVSSLITTGLLLAPLLLGIGAGHALFPFLSQRVFKALLNAILFAAELYLLASLWGAIYLS